MVAVPAADRRILLVFVRTIYCVRNTPVVPAKCLPSSGVVGGGDPVAYDERRWVPAFAGMTELLTCTVLAS